MNYSKARLGMKNLTLKYFFKDQRQERKHSASDYLDEVSDGDASSEKKSQSNCSSPQKNVVSESNL